MNTMKTWKGMAAERLLQSSNGHRSQSAADLEAFQNHIVMYPSKCYAFSLPVYEARVLLASLDYNFNHNPPTVKTAEGKEM
ncbi:uncharacterized protein AKAME5_001834700 [Lates japonicus]|uniref:Uncharacterized protein n=1 Tax=Lates japonicus TaxID=270547 RepID=A0AAD3RFP7_LATJO|nr:uncharacterized protein AKAME5_001834700 [Lates japonicus]